MLQHRMWPVGVGFPGVAPFCSSSSVQQQRIALRISVSAVLAIRFVFALLPFGRVHVQ